jgi:nicotinate-nucleotide adenylyltransferase
VQASDSQVILTRRVAVYGGTFDPLHNGHLQVACAITEAFALDQLLLVPAAVPPHKRGLSICSPYHRMAMLALATAELPRIAVSPLELEAPERPYTIETLGKLEQLDPASRIFFVMGADSFRDITSWREYRRILTEYDVIVAVRPGYLAEEIATSGMVAHLPPELRQRVVDLRGRHLPMISQLTNRHIYLTDYVNVAISATEVRQAAAQGRSLAGIVPPPVADYIAKYKLYQYPQ